MYENIYYIEFNKDYTCLYYEKRRKVFMEEYCKVLNKMCLRQIVTLKGRKDAFSKMWGSKYNVPLYIDENHLFFKVDSNLLIRSNMKCEIKAG